MMKTQQLVEHNMYKYQQKIVFIKTHYIEYLQYSHPRMANFHFQGITVFGGTDHVSACGEL